MQIMAPSLLEDLTQPSGELGVCLPALTRFLHFSLFVCILQHAVKDREASVSVNCFSYRIH